ncbi:hypothetical protein MMC08_006199 [Hypocenomyce scalaris]|nr:hypothetical protein [Hypocenomyce scalaris]
MRYAVDWCIFGFPTANDQVLSNPCIVTCDYVANTLETNIITPNISSPYGYCQGGPAFLSNLSSCAYCESLVPNRFYLSNFLNTLKAACQSQPSSSTAFPISPVQIFTLHPPASYPTTTSTTHGLSHGATIAIGIIVPLVILLLLALFSVYWYRRYKSSNSPSHKYRPQQSLFDERWGDTQITRPSGGTSQYASDYLPPSGSQSYFPAPKGGAQTQYSSVPLETQYPPAKSQHQLSREEERRYSQPHPYHPSGVHDANTKGKSREAGMTVTTPPAQVKKSQKRSFGKTVTGMNLPIGRKPKVTVDTVRVGRERDDYGESPSDLFG